ncbi:MAG: BON domain-containing protein, partial [Planctomycetes bacterium]|nr:BON domain-containing protein [Planctomycetota bacterium]
MRKYGKWALTLGLLAATPGLTFAEGVPAPVGGQPAVGQPESGVDNQKVAEEIASAMKGKVQGNVNIEYRDGVATLSGSVNDARIKDRATGLTSRVPGVVRVDNQLTVVEKGRRFTSRMTDPSDGGVRSANHEDSSPKSNRVRQVNGIAPATVSHNQAFAEKIGSALAASGLDGYDVQVQFQSGTATLDGTVGNAAERATASKVAQSIPGVVNVVNRLNTEDRSAPYSQTAQGPGGPQGNIYGVAYRQAPPGAAPIPLGASPSGAPVQTPPSPAPAGAVPTA